MTGGAHTEDTRRAPRYVSTRTGGEDVSFGEALLAGLAPDGGLFVPTHVPLVAEGWRQQPTFVALAEHLLTPWLRETVGADTLRTLLADALSFDVPLVPLGGADWESVSILELFHGPTLSFKDFGARTMARLMGQLLEASGERLTILVATSGDTGSAVADGFAGQDRIHVVLLYPKGQVSPVQEQQLIVARDGVTTRAVDGTFDDCQRLVKEAFRDEALADVPLSSANSINVGRLLPQMLYYAWALAQHAADEVVTCVPSGNLGNLTGGVLAHLGGIPLQRFIAAHNANDSFPRFLEGERVLFGPSVRTLSNAMDVGAPSNFERLQALLPDGQMQGLLWGTSVNDEQTVTTMRAVHEAAGYVADPHTAVGLEAVRRYRAVTGDATPVVVLATAHPAKFPDVVERALGMPPEVPARLARLDGEPVAVRPMAPTLEALREVLQERSPTP